MDNPYVDEAAKSWPESFAESEKRAASLSPREQVELLKLGNQITESLAGLFSSNFGTDSEQVQVLIGEHFEWVSRFWTPNAESYVGLGNLYVDDSRFSEFYDGHAMGLAVFVRDAIKHWAVANLE